MAGAAARFLASPCLPFCCGIIVSHRRQSRSAGSVTPYRPLGKSKVHLASALDGNALILLEASADNTGGDSQVAVVAIREMWVSSSARSRSVGAASRRGGQLSNRQGEGSIDVPQASGFPRSSHFGGVWRVGLGGMGNWWVMMAESLLRITGQRQS